MSARPVTDTGTTASWGCPVIPEDNAESTEQVVPAAQKVPETTLTITECIKPNSFGYTGKEQHK